MRNASNYVKSVLGNDLVIVEIGVLRGHNAVEMLSGLSIKQLYLVDPYLPFWDGYITSHEEMLKYYEEFVVHTKAMDKSKYTQIFKTSVEASKTFENKFFDYIYIDADHLYEAIKLDLLHWYPKLRDGGVIGGHDFAQPAVQQAVLEFAKEHNLPLRYTEIDQDWWVPIDKGYDATNIRNCV